MSCGACCASFRVSFYWAETTDATANGVPAELTEKVSALRCAMRGTAEDPLRCIALRGNVGVQVHCTIYERRSSTCREFAVAWAQGQSNEICDSARLRHGLTPLPNPHIVTTST